MSKKLNDKMFVVSVDMGYGHLRAAHPFLDDCVDTIINANNYAGIPKKERKSWTSGRKMYEIISYFKRIPFLGDLIFSMMDYFQRIDSFYPRRDLSKTSYQQNHFFKKVKKGLGKKLIENLSKETRKEGSLKRDKHPAILSTFFVPVYFSEYYKYPGKVYCIICDADISRAWAPVSPTESNTIYFAPNRRVKERLKLYGVKDKNILVTGFPLPKDNIGGIKQPILKDDLRKRIINLDPEKSYRKKYCKLLEDHLGSMKGIKNDTPLVITFAVGGAGAQRQIGVDIVNSLKNKIKAKKVKVNLVAGSRNDVYTFFKESLEALGLKDDKNVVIIYDENKIRYFKKFNKVLRSTDILWTKPSELTFYSGLGLPIIMSEPIGSQEHYNRDWLVSIGAGVDSLDPKYTNEWLFDWLSSGWLAKAAMEGYVNAPSMGTYNIEHAVLEHKDTEITDDIQLL